MNRNASIRPTERRRRPRPGGAILVGTLVCLVLVTALVSSMLQAALQSRRQLRVEQQLRQASLLLQAGRAHATAQLASDSAYPGETLRLEVPGDEEVQFGQVTIRPARAEDEEHTRVEVVARYPADSPRPIQRTLTYTLPQPSP